MILIKWLLDRAWIERLELVMGAETTSVSCFKPMTFGRIRDDLKAIIATREWA
jgi:hypothetical protein